MLLLLLSLTETYTYVNAAYKNTLQEGKVQVYRGRIMFIGGERTGKTKTKKSLLGKKFHPQEESTVGIEVDSSSLECDGDHVVRWETQTFEAEEAHLTGEVARLVAKQAKVNNKSRKIME